MIWLLGGYMWLFVHRPFEIWPALGALQIERVYMLIMLVVWLLAPNKGLVPNRIHAALAIFTVILVAAWLLSPYMDQPRCTEAIEDYCKVVVFYVLVITTVRDERGLRLLILLYLGTMSLYMAHSMLEFANGRYEWRMGIRRMIGVNASFGDSNGFASTLLYSLPLTIPLWASRPSMGFRVMMVGYTLCVCMCIALTGSRSGFIALCVFTMLVLLVTIRRKALVIVLSGVIGTAGLGVAVVALPAELQNRYLTIIDSSYGPKNAAVSASGRMDGLVYGIEAWEKSPLLGHGPRGFDFATGRGGGAHNLYGQVLSEMGVLGALALLGLILCFALNCREVRSFHRDHPDEPRSFSSNVVRAIGINILLMLLLGWGGHTLFRYNWQWFAAFQAIAVHCIRQKKKELDDTATLVGGTGRLPYLRGRPASPLTGPYLPAHG
jgi:O-antigen ligase